MKCPDANGERLGLTLSLAWFGVKYLAPVVQIQIAIALGLALGLAQTFSRQRVLYVSLYVW